MATLLAFHAHPDDEVLLTGGTLARARLAAVNSQQPTGERRSGRVLVMSYMFVRLRGA
jgi:hypothetical protein